MKEEFNLEEVINGLMEEIRTLPPGKEALNKLKILRGNYEIKVSGYRNSLKILSDTTYKDRKHFLLELIQNADDATYNCEKPELTFIMHKDVLELEYNEKGFTVEDVIAITDTGSSTKKLNKIDSNSFIGEKGIGFKSVFALASEVEIESFPWHFKLNSDTVIVPEVLDSSESKYAKGTSMKIKFKESSSMDIISNELFKFVDGSMESFLFLQKLSSFKLIDRREETEAEYSIHMEPANRKGKNITIKALPKNKKRKYTTYTEELPFERELIWERWENPNFDFDIIKRNITAAALIDSQEDKALNGKVFCYLPTEITIPIPIFLQFDGHLTADRGRLHDPENNRWNKKIVEFLPDFLLNAILNWRENKSINSKIPNYIPYEEGTDQLSGAIKQLKEKLEEAPWIMTNDERNLWVTPKEALIPDVYFASIFKKYPKFMAKVQNVLNKKFVNLKWAAQEKWTDLMRDYYYVKNLSTENILHILSEVGMPSEILKDDRELTKLYKQIFTRVSLDSKNKCYFKSGTNEKQKLLSSKMYPIRQNKRLGFTSLKNSEDDKVFFMNSAKENNINIPGFKYKIIDFSYTYIPSISKDLNKEKAKSLKLIKERNQALLDILKFLGIQELNNLTLLKEVLISTIKDSELEDLEDANITKFDILMYIFNTYLENKENSKYAEALHDLYDCYFKDEDGNECLLYEMLIPRDYRTDPLDYLYDPIDGDVLAVPEKFKDELNENKKEFRNFLLKCGIRNKPGFYTVNEKYDEVYYFNNSDKERFKSFNKKIRDYTQRNIFKVNHIEFDDISIKLLNSNKADLDLVEKSIYENWMNNYKDVNIDEDSIYSYSEPSISPGYFRTTYMRYETRHTIIEDYLWAGVSRDKIPLRQINGEVVSSSKVKYCPKLKNQTLISILGEMPVVLVDDKEAGYDDKYIKSLKVQKIKLENLNILWHLLEKEQYIYILKLSLELFNLGCEVGEFKIYDIKKGDIRDYNDFRIGDIVYNNIPSISKQYGDTGEKLGKLLNLKEERAAKGYKDVFDYLITDDGTIEEVEKEKFLNMLRNWRKWTTYDKAYISNKLKGRLKKLGINYRPVVVNTIEEEMRLTDTNILYVSLDVEKNEYYTLKKAAIEIGFSSIEDFGRLILTDEDYLEMQEKNKIKNYLRQYENMLEDNERAKFLGLFDFCGGIDNIQDNILRVGNAGRKIDEFNQIEIELPYIDKDQGRIIVSEELDAKDIAMKVVSLLEFAPFRTIKRDFNDFRDISEDYDELKLDQDCNLDLDGSNENLMESVQQDIIDSLKDNRTLFQYEIDKQWTNGPMPEEEERIRESLSTKIQETINAGSQHYIKRLIQNKVVFKNKDIANPKEFLHNEYGGKCQICGTELKLHNGTSYINVFHIKERRNKSWWSNNPFNILGLCPNCHALAKYGGERDFSSIYKSAKEMNLGDLFPEEVEEFSGDYYVVDIVINGTNKKMVISKIHMNYFAALFSKDESEEEIAANRG